MTAAVRLRLLAAAERPSIVGFDQEEFARRLYYDRPIEASVDAFKSARRTTAEILERMTRPSGRARARTASTAATRWSAGSRSTDSTHNHAEQIRVARGSARK